MQMPASVVASEIVGHGMENQNPDPLNPKGPATRKSRTSSSSLSYCSGIIQIARVRQQENTRKGGPPAVGLLYFVTAIVTRYWEGYLLVRPINRYWRSAHLKGGGHVPIEKVRGNSMIGAT